MAVTAPRATNLADLYRLAPLDWDDVRRPLEANLTQEPGTGGPDHHYFWLATADADGRPHMTAMGAFWLDGERGPRAPRRGRARRRRGSTWAKPPSATFGAHSPAASAGPPPWYIYEMTLEDVQEVAMKEPGGATRWSF
jgi:hypothetical protein